MLSAAPRNYRGDTMAVGGVNYPSPVMVNGYSCRNCADVDLATKGIDPVHPQSGPNNRDAATDPSRQSADPAKIAAAKRAAEVAAQDIAGYSLAGAVAGSIEPGSAFTLAA